MDSSLIISMVVAVLAVVPGIWALVNQANKDKNQARMDMNKAANEAAIAIIAPLQLEVSRLQNRVTELEKTLVDKTNEIGNLMQAGIDKDSQIRKLTYTISDMQTRLDTFEIRRKISNKIKSENGESGSMVVSTNPKLEEELKADQMKKEEIKNYTLKSIEHITNGSIVNNQNTEESEE